MKLISKTVIAAAFVMLIAPMAAQAQDCYFHRAYYPGWRHHDVVRDHRDLRGDWRDVRHDRFRLRRDIAYGNWNAARAQRLDIARDRADIRGDRWDVYRDYGPPAQPYYFVR